MIPESRVPLNNTSNVQMLNFFSILAKRVRFVNDILFLTSLIIPSSRQLFTCTLNTIFKE